jgi:hypothetical protein
MEKMKVKSGESNILKKFFSPFMSIHPYFLGCPSLSPLIHQIESFKSMYFFTTKIWVLEVIFMGLCFVVLPMK